ncbi:MAG: hypothetical protein HW405_127 [Candidatus Berkelbacteria bacterium]|nr:hypothetical protein [Candidatus Berkelbacteria bacterium]
MGKKDKSKFKKRLHAEILKEIQKTDSNQPSQTPEIINEPVTPKMQDNLPSSAQLKTASEDPPVLQDSLGLVRSDLKKSAIIIGSIIILIVALFFIDNKTGLLLKFGTGLFRILHIGA